VTGTILPLAVVRSEATQWGHHSKPFPASVAVVRSFVHVPTAGLVSELTHPIYVPTQTVEGFGSFMTECAIVRSVQRPRCGRWTLHLHVPSLWRTRPVVGDALGNPLRPQTTSADKGERACVSRDAAPGASWSRSGLAPFIHSSAHYGRRHKSLFHPFQPPRYIGFLIYSTITR
jgi:hypothetical protein